MARKLESISNHVGAGALTRPGALACGSLFRGSGNPGVAQR